MYNTYIHTYNHTYICLVLGQLSLVIHTVRLIVHFILINAIAASGRTSHQITVFFRLDTAYIHTYIHIHIHTNVITNKNKNLFSHWPNISANVCILSVERIELQALYCMYVLTYVCTVCTVCMYV